MYKSGHFGISLLCYAPILYLLIEINLLLAGFIGLFTVIVFCSTPDLDLKIPKVKHRGYSHTVLGAAFMSPFLGFFIAAVYHYGTVMFEFFNIDLIYSTGQIALVATVFAFFTLLTHYIGDIFTPTGLKPLAPFNKKRYTLDLFYAKNPLANGLACILGIVSIVVVLHLQFGITG